MPKMIYLFNSTPALTDCLFAMQNLRFGSSFFSDFLKLDGRKVRKVTKPGF